MTKIAPGSHVCVHLALSLPDGTQALSTFEEEPMRFVLGDGTLTEGLEAALYGLEAGSDQTLRVDGNAVFGPWQEERVIWIPLENFDEEIQPEPGQVVAFSNEAGDTLPGMILETDAERAQVDFNHPLSGRELEFRVQVLSVAPPAANA